MSIADCLEEHPDVLEAERALHIEGDPVTGLVRRTVELLRSGDPRAETCLRELAGKLAAGDHLVVRVAMEAIGIRLAVQAGRLDTAGLGTLPSCVHSIHLALGHCPLDQDEPTVMVCRCQDHRWWLSFGDRTALVDDGLGMRFLAALIADPGRVVDAVDLAVNPLLLDEPLRDGDGTCLPTRGGPVEQIFREHLSWLRAEIDDLEAAGVTWGNEARRAERDRITASLAAAARSGGEPHHELIGVAVGQAIRRTLAGIAAADRVIGNELRATVQVGARCSYRPR